MGKLYLLSHSTFTYSQNTATMEAARAAVNKITGQRGHHTTVEESVNPAVVQETIKPHRHEEATQAVDREVHQHHYHTTKTELAPLVLTVIEPAPLALTVTEPATLALIVTELATLASEAVDDMMLMIRLARKSQACCR